MAQATITSKGQVTIPQSVRDSLGLRTGDRIVFEEVRDGRATIRLAQRFTVDDFVGIVPQPARARSIEEMRVAARNTAKKRHARP